MSDFLENMSKNDELLEDIETCGMSYHMWLWAQVAKEMLSGTDIYENESAAIKAWEEESRRRWQESKFFKLYQAEIAADRNPHLAFEKLGWEM